MLNLVTLVGRLTSDVKILKDEKGNDYAIVNIAVPRIEKNENGEFGTDFIKCDLIGSIATNTSQYCNKGDIIGIKGRIKTENDIQKIVAEKVTFLSSNKKED